MTTRRGGPIGSRGGVLRCQALALHSDSNRVKSILSARQQLPAAIGFTLLLLVGWTFLPSLGNGFIDVDDAGYISENVHVRNGFSWSGLGWAFTNTVGGSWHPLTWFSLMLDCQLFGVRPAGHHFTDLLLHAANTILLFLVFRRMTGAIWRSAFVATLFAVHPLHVESVVWAAERKDTLSTLFWMLTLLMYAVYAQQAKNRLPSETPDARCSNPFLPASRYYRLSLLFFVCGLMSKPMLVTLPCVLLLLDWWPLRRFQISALSAQVRGPGCAFGHPLARQLLDCVLEKSPFFALALVISVLTVYSQGESGAVSSLANVTIYNRLENSTLSYVRYLAEMFWPAGLGPFYPLPQVFPVWPVLGAGLVLLAITVFLLSAARKTPELAVGWLWYLVTLLPVIGLIQVGHQSHADRYTYIPLIGIFVVVVWGACDLTGRWRFQQLALSTLAIAVTLACVSLTRRQIRYWKDSETLFCHALDITEKNELAHDILGTVLVRQGRLDEGIPHLRAALRLAPAYARAHNDLGAALGRQGHEDQAMGEFEMAIRFDPKLAEAHRNLALALEKLGRLDEAASHLQVAVQSEPDFAEAHRNLGVALGKQGRLDEAIDQLTQAIRLNSGDAEAQSSLGITLGKRGRLDDAIVHLKMALELKPSSAEAHCNLGVALGAKGDIEGAIAHLQAALKLKPDYPDARNNLQTALELKSAKPSVLTAPARP